MKKLFVVPTPIGNLADMTYRGVEVLSQVGLIVAEDTRVSKKLLNHFEIKTPMISFHDYSDESRIREIVGRMETDDVALICDAGTPGVSDPGFVLVKEVRRKGGGVEVLPGANAVLPAIVGSGLASDRFVFLGFLPKKMSKRVEVLRSVKHLPFTLVFYESPHHVQQTLRDLYEVLGNRRACLCREISKVHEEYIELPLEGLVELCDHRSIVGEMVLVMEGYLETVMWDEAMVKQVLIERLETGALSKVSAQVAKEAGWRKSEVYNLGLKVQKGQDED